MQEFHWQIRHYIILSLVLFLTIWIISCDSQSDKDELLFTNGTVAINISPNVPTDIPGGASNADLQTAAMFAWQEFIALNWAAVDQNGNLNTRDIPNRSKLFGDPNNVGPLVWETYRHKAEIYPGQGHNPPGYIDSAALDYGYDHPPEYNYLYPVPPCSDEDTSYTAWVNLDEVTQIALDDMYAGTLRDVKPTERNKDPQLLRFLAKANRTYYDYVAKKNYWNFGGNYYSAVTTFTNAINADKKTVPPDSLIVNFPDGSIEIKAAWRLLKPGEDRSRFHTAPVRFYANSNANPNSLLPQPCYCQDTAQVWGLVALHIIHKTPSAPYFIFATFEQADNILTPDGKPVEDENGNIINQPAGNGPTTPGTIYNDPLAPNATTPPPLGITTNGPFVPDSQLGNRLYYENLANGLPQDSSEGSIAVNKRYLSIPSDIIAINKAVHQVISAYNTKNGIKSSPWQYYKLINVQWMPFNNTQIDTTNPNGIFNPSTYYQANIVVETNNTLQQFSGQQIGPAPPPFTSFSIKYSGEKSYYDFLNKPFHNVYVPGDSVFNPIRMGGCMGCHGNAQVAGADFSFILFFGPVQFPEFPEKDDDGRLRKYLNSRYRTVISQK